MPRTTLALLGWLACFSASSGGVLSAVTWSCLELFTYLLHENRQEVMQKFGFLSQNHGSQEYHGWCGDQDTMSAVAESRPAGRLIRRIARPGRRLAPWQRENRAL